MRRQDGFVTVAALALALVLAAVAVVVTLLGAVAVARHRAASAADLAALAAGAHALEGPDAACAAAARIATGQGATVRDCRLDGLDALVTVTVAPRGLLGRLGVARATARAGPEGTDRPVGASYRSRPPTGGGCPLSRALRDTSGHVATKSGTAYGTTPTA